MDKFILISSSGISNGAIYALIGFGIVLLTQATGVINFAQGDLLSLGAFLAFWLVVRHSVPQWLSFLLVIAVLFAVGILLERVGYAPIRARSQTAVIITTFALGSAIRAGLTLWFDNVPQSLPSPVGAHQMKIGRVAITDQDLLIVAVSIVVLVALYALMHRSAMGRQVRALAADREAAILQGIRVNRLAPILFGLSAAMAGLAGVLIAPQLSVTPTLGFNLLLSTFAAVVLGGETLGGVAVAALFIALFQAYAAGYVAPKYVDAYPYLVLVLVLIVRPNGLRRALTDVRY